MRARRVWASAAAAVMVAGGVFLVAAPAASAATFPVNADTCADLGGTFVDSFIDYCSFDEEVVIDEGDVWVIDGVDVRSEDGNTFNNNGVIEVSSNWALFNLAGSVFNNNGTINLADGSILFNFNATATFNNFGVITYCLAGIDAVVNGNAPLQVCPDPEPDPEAAADAPPIPAWVQAYGRASADATCLDGWFPSWDQWPNGGAGGFVCQRSIPSLG